MFKVSPLFDANYNATEHIVVNQGGTYSGKTYAIDQTLFTKLSEQPKKIATVVGQDIPNLKSGALRDALNIYEDSKELQSMIKSYNRSERIFEFKNKSIMEFKSYDSPQDAKNGKRDFLFINEANGVPKLIYDELALRTNQQIFIDYNPNAEFWVHDDLLGKPGVQLFISDHRHNPFIQQAQRDKIEALKDKDYELWKVYARGLTGKIEGLIFRNWNVVDAIPAGAKFICNGLDFGFTNDVSASINVFLQDGELWLDELFYQNGLTNPDICNKFAECGLQKNQSIVGDSSEPKSIKEISVMGYQIEGAEKGPDSVNASIDILKRYKMNVTRQSVNLRKELNNYKWKVDRLSGKALNEPVDAFNHAIDAVRYVALNKLKNDVKTGTKFTVHLRR
ncbi:MAG TPA: terminase large subunit [Bacteroidia bacterium]|jgi:phage terminase large subunit|nr:terminase large subunit [Bacteroidia bacterium]